MIILWQAFMFFVIASAIYGAWKWFHFSLLMPSFAFVSSVPGKIRAYKKQKHYKEKEQQKLQFEYLKEVYVKNWNPEQLVLFRKQIFGTPPRPWQQEIKTTQTPQENYYFIFAEMIGTRQAYIINDIRNWSKEKDEFFLYICPDDLRDMVKDPLSIQMEKKALEEFDKDDKKAA